MVHTWHTLWTHQKKRELIKVSIAIGFDDTTKLLVKDALEVLDNLENRIENMSKEILGRTLVVLYSMDSPCSTSSRPLQMPSGQKKSFAAVFRFSHSLSADYSITYAPE